MKAGIVKFFDSRPEKRFGFVIEDKTNNEIFFHLNDGQKIYAGKVEPEFDPNRRLDRTPQKGDRLVFNTAMGSKGIKACPWGFEDEFNTALVVISDCPQPTVYRIISGFRIVGTGDETEPVVDWVGTDLNERGLERHYHPLYDRPGGNGDIEWQKTWEKSTNGGKTWTTCGCPKEYMDQFDGRGNRRISRY